jgi:2',3'-cyclic-nucleotide 2'-phosphodiesterase
MKILFFGDIVGKIGRRAISEVLPEYRKKYSPDLVIANGENLAHGIGITERTVEEMFEAGIDILTSGNHIYKKKGYEEVFTQYGERIIRPANYPEGVSGSGYTTIKVKGKRIVVINLMGRVFMQENFDDPFKKYDQIEKLLKIAKSDIVIVDFHGEATSEKNGFGWHVDGRASAVFGTHTHVPTADLKILPQGTSYLTDIGMVGGRDTIIGVEREGPLTMFLTQLPVSFEKPEEGVVQVNAVLVSIDEKTGRAKTIKRVDQEIEIN